MVRTSPQYPPSRAAVLPLVGGALAFDLTNTSSGRGGPKWLEHLQTAENVVDWARHAKILTARDAGRLSRQLAGDQRLAAALLDAAHELRELIHTIGLEIATTGRARAKPMADLVGIHAECLAQARLAPSASTFAWVWDPAHSPREAILGPIVLSALSLLTGSDLTRIKRCPGDHCGWLFFDLTKNKRRRWCEMEVCGNRAKQKRRRQRS
jgi:predicted RNA-binding Zn ribbon-like protein